ncbi:glyceraldehyde-3-phosphate dehydrogenase [Marinibactrum halimedae]|uniref:Glyceraldehyde-3-phosphate dehydrogenase n=1 Tax=Marinibactrum halimedae TaxID=1444977 RepID=A0AA37T6X6_9GAMM|nr:glyceraldehyde-3-phosphate dehydrogenase [Marinibactrum halimedae]MCD9459486.1 glyceraldehyde-3-phosphate dehydrogenase [Marinibactrum halimedae]GLS28140.1 glyceraldehyde-3-phosphate dehydrogenase [Marinibactrum halimedae]
MNRPKPDDFFKDWKAREALAESMIPMVGKLYRERNVSITIYGKPLVNRSVIDIMKAHRFVRQVEQNELSEFESFPMLEAICNLDIVSAEIDLGKLTVACMNAEQTANITAFAEQELAEVISNTNQPLEAPQDVVLYGFGRIGRLVARLLVENAGGGDCLRLKAIVVRKGGAANDLVKRASLLRRDSVHGSFKGTIRVDEETNTLVVNGNEVKVIYANNPAEIDYTEYGIDNAIVVDNTGVWRDEDGLGQHLQSKGVKKVILTAPGKGNLKNIVYGINNKDILPEDTIVSAASCTTNAIVPVLKSLLDKFGVRHGHVETVHAFTNDQNLIDNYHKGERRGRAAPLNMVLTETGAAKAVAKALPELKGKLTGNAIRVPTPNVSMAILNLQLEEETTKEGLNEYMRDVALHSSLNLQIDYTNSPEVVSSDFVGSRHACVFDAKATIVDGQSAVIYLWYDNEFGYSCQVVRCLEDMAGLALARYPAKAALAVQ